MLDLRPSFSPTWVHCLAAPRFAAMLPEQPSTDASREGTAAAWVADMCLSGAVLRAYDLDGETYENGWLVDTDMCYHVQDYVDMVQARGGKIEAEKFVRLNEFIAGTLDSSAVLTNRVLYVDDLKFGYGIVEPTTPQIVIYGEAQCRLLESQGLTIETVVLGIFQPRANHVDGRYRSRTLTREQLSQEAAWIIARGNAAQQPDSVATPGDHCKHCPAATSCEALNKTILEAFEVVESKRISPLDEEGLSRELSLLERIDKLVSARKNAVEAEAEHIIKNSGFIPGWGMVSGSGRRRFRTGVSTMTVEALTGIKATKEVAKSPAEIEKDGNAATKKVMKLLAETPQTTRKLKRVDRTAVAKQFETKGY